MKNRRRETMSVVRNSLFLLGLIGLLCIVESVLAAPLILAAQDSTAASKAEAAYICDGVDDQVEINAAIRELGPAGGTVILSEGVFNCSGPESIVCPPFTVFTGRGEDVTEIRYENSECFPYVARYRGYIGTSGSDVIFSDFSLTGTGWIYLSGSRISVRNVTVSTREAAPHTVQSAFYVCADGSVVEDIEFLNCSAVDCNSFGFMNDANESASTKLIRNIRYTNCQAINCGRFGRYDDWDVGFDIVENNDLEDCRLVGCLAEGCWESGFHLEGSSDLLISDVVFEDCISRNNGQKPDARWGAGFVTSRSTSFINCVSRNNKVGFYLNGDISRPSGGIRCDNCRDEGSGTGYSVVGCDGGKFTGCSSVEAGKFGFYFVRYCRNCEIADCVVTDARGDGTFLNYIDPTVASCHFDLLAEGGASPEILNTGGDGNTYDLAWGDGKPQLPQPSYRPDLVVSSILLSPAVPDPGDHVLLLARITNRGDTPTENGVVHGILFRIRRNASEVYEDFWSDSYDKPISPGESVHLVANTGVSGYSKWGPRAGTYTISVFADDLNAIAESNEGNNILSSLIVVNPTSGLVPFPLYTGVPTDVDQDGAYEDINGNGRMDYDDVVAYYRNLGWVAANQPLDAFDFNRNGRIDFDDVIRLYQEIRE